MTQSNQRSPATSEAREARECKTEKGICMNAFYAFMYFTPGLNVLVTIIFLFVLKKSWKKTILALIPCILLTTTYFILRFDISELITHLLKYSLSGVLIWYSILKQKGKEINDEDTASE